MKKYLNLRENQSVFTSSLCDLARIILTENYFELGKDMYHQKLGGNSNRYKVCSSICEFVYGRSRE